MGRMISTRMQRGMINGAKSMVLIFLIVVFQEEYGALRTAIL